MPDREKRPRSPVRSLHVPSHVPNRPQNAAKVRGFSLTASGFTAETDWLLEERGFELLVPRKRDAVPITTSPAKCDNVRRAVSFATFQTTTYRSGGSLKSAARRIRNPGGSARETHGIGTPARCRAANRPSVTGMVSWVWVNALLMWAGMSSGPSSLWRYGATFSGTMRGRKASRSRLTSGDAFSWISSGAEVCGMERVRRPTEMPWRSVHLATSAVISLISRGAVAIERRVCAM
jgi:hypothetical protein